jgi:hypothetical protein
MDSGSFVCTVTKVAELTCRQLQGDGNTVVGWLDKWQDFAGALLAAFVGVIGALIVAGTAMRRQRTLSANVLLPEIESFVEANAKFKSMTFPDDERTSRLRALYVEIVKPRTESLNREDVNQLLDIDERLHTHLLRLRNAQRDLDDYIAKCKLAVSALDQAENKMHAATSATLQSEKIRGEMELALAKSQVALLAPMVSSKWWLCVRHADLAAYFIRELAAVGYLKRNVRKLRMKFLPNEHDRLAKQLMQAIERNAWKEADERAAE